VYDPSLLKTEQKAPRHQRMMVWGLIVSMGGLGIAVMTALSEGLSEAGIGLLVVFIGVGLIAAAGYLRNLAEKEEQKTNRHDDSDVLPAEPIQ